MGSSGGGDSSGAMAMLMSGSQIPGLPVAGKDTAIDPYTYGQFQNFLPDPVAEGPNAMASGLRPEMFNYQKPGAAAGAAAAPAAASGRDALAAIAAGSGGGGVGTMGMGGMYGRGSPANGVGPPPGATPLPTPPGGWAPGNVPGWPRGGPGTPISQNAVNADPSAAAAALAAAKASGG